MPNIDTAALERLLGRRLTGDEQALVQVCGASLRGLAWICIQEGITIRAATKIKTLFDALLEGAAQKAGRAAADIVMMERLAPGSIIDDKRAN